MNTKIAASIFAALVTSAGLFAQASESSAPQIAVPSTPAPAVNPAQAQAQAPAAMPAPNQLVYVPRLPSAQELTNAAAAQGRTIERIEQTSSQITLIYKDANGASTTVAYQLLPNAGSTATATNQPVVVAPPATTAPTVYYAAPAPRVYYYDSYPAYYSYPWYPPVSLNLGFGYYRGWGGGWGYHGGYRGGFHHGR